MKGEKEAKLRLRFSDTAAWARKYGFRLERAQLERRGFLLRRTYRLVWRDADKEWHAAPLGDLASVEPFITARIAAGEACRPGEWYVSWGRREISAEDQSWCRWPFWVVVVASEGISDRHPDSPNTSDPTPYPSPEAAISYAGLLGLEMGARVSLTARVLNLANEWTWLPTPAYTIGAVEELVLDCVRGSAPTSAPGAPLVIADRLFRATDLHREEGERVVRRLLQERRLCWKSRTGSTGQALAILTVVDEQSGAVWDEE